MLQEYTGTTRARTLGVLIASMTPLCDEMLIHVTPVGTCKYLQVDGTG